jgi:hypothetical protein
MTTFDEIVKKFNETILNPSSQFTATKKEVKLLSEGAKLVIDFFRKEFEAYFKQRLIEILPNKELLSNQIGKKEAKDVLQWIKKNAGINTRIEDK